MGYLVINGTSVWSVMVNFIQKVNGRISDKKVKSCLLGEVEYAASWYISMPLTYYIVIQRRRIDNILNHQGGFLKKDPQICLDEGPPIWNLRLHGEKSWEKEEAPMGACKSEMDSCSVGCGVRITPFISVSAAPRAMTSSPLKIPWCKKWQLLPHASIYPPSSKCQWALDLVPSS